MNFKWKKEYIFRMVAASALIIVFILRHFKIIFLPPFDSIAIALILICYQIVAFFKIYKR